MSLPSKSFVFTPGYRTRICNFIQDVNQKVVLSKLQPPSKKMKIADSDDSGGSSASQYDLKAIYEDLRDRIINWIRKKPEEFHIIEHTHYKIIVRFQESGYPTVDVLCLLSNCNAMIRLGVKNDERGNYTHILSNWTHHVLICFKKKKAKHGNQVGIATFFTKKPKCKEAIVDQQASLTKEDFQKAPLVQEAIVEQQASLSKEDFQKATLVQEAIVEQQASLSKEDFQKVPLGQEAMVEQQASLIKEDFPKASLVQVNQEGQS